MAFAVRIWPIEIDTDASLGDSSDTGCRGALGEDAPWCIEPAWWEADGVISPANEVHLDDGYLDYMVELDRVDLAAKDAAYRARSPWLVNPAMAAEMDRALADDSPFRRFIVWAFEWESGLPD